MVRPAADAVVGEIQRLVDQRPNVATAGVLFASAQALEAAIVMAAFDAAYDDSVDDLAADFGTLPNEALHDLRHVLAPTSVV